MSSENPLDIAENGGVDEKRKSLPWIPIGLGGFFLVTLITLGILYGTGVIFGDDEGNKIKSEVKSLNPNDPKPPTKFVFSNDEKFVPEFKELFNNPEELGRIENAKNIEELKGTKYGEISPKQFSLIKAGIADKENFKKALNSKEAFAAYIKKKEGDKAVFLEAVPDVIKNEVNKEVSNETADTLDTIKDKFGKLKAKFFGDTGLNEDELAQVQELYIKGREKDSTKAAPFDKATFAEYFKPLFDAEVKASPTDTKWSSLFNAYKSILVSGDSIKDYTAYYESIKSNTEPPATTSIDAEYKTFADGLLVSITDMTKDTSASWSTTIDTFIANNVTGKKVKCTRLADVTRDAILNNFFTAKADEIEEKMFEEFKKGYNIATENVTSVIDRVKKIIAFAGAAKKSFDTKHAEFKAVTDANTATAYMRKKFPEYFRAELEDVKKIATLDEAAVTNEKAKYAHLITNLSDKTNLAEPFTAMFKKDGEDLCTALKCERPFSGSSGQYTVVRKELLKKISDKIIAGTLLGANECDAIISHIKNNDPGVGEAKETFTKAVTKKEILNHLYNEALIAAAEAIFNSSTTPNIGTDQSTKLKKFADLADPKITDHNEKLSTKVAELIKNAMVAAVKDSKAETDPEFSSEFAKIAVAKTAPLVDASVETILPASETADAKKAHNYIKATIEFENNKEAFETLAKTPLTGLTNGKAEHTAFITTPSATTFKAFFDVISSSAPDVKAATPHIMAYARLASSRITLDPADKTNVIPALNVILNGIIGEIGAGSTKSAANAILSIPDLSIGTAVITIKTEVGNFVLTEAKGKEFLEKLVEVKRIEMNFEAPGASRSKAEQCLNHCKLGLKILEVREKFQAIGLPFADSQDLKELISFIENSANAGKLASVKAALSSVVDIKEQEEKAIGTTVADATLNSKQVLAAMDLVAELKKLVCTPASTANGAFITANLNLSDPSYDTLLTALATATTNKNETIEALFKFTEFAPTSEKKYAHYKAKCLLLPGAVLLKSDEYRAFWNAKNNVKLLDAALVKAKTDGKLVDFRDIVDAECNKCVAKSTEAGCNDMIMELKFTLPYLRLKVQLDEVVGTVGKDLKKAIGPNNFGDYTTNRESGVKKAGADEAIRSAVHNYHDVQDAMNHIYGLKYSKDIIDVTATSSYKLSHIVHPSPNRADYIGDYDYHMVYDVIETRFISKSKLKYENGALENSAAPTDLVYKAKDIYDDFVAKAKDQMTKDMVNSYKGKGLSRPLLDLMSELDQPYNIIETKTAEFEKFQGHYVAIALESSGVSLSA